MADEKYTFEFTSDEKSAVDGMKSVQSALRKIKEEQKALNATMKTGAGAFNVLGGVVKGLTGGVFGVLGTATKVVTGVFSALWTTLKGLGSFLTGVFSQAWRVTKIGLTGMLGVIGAVTVALGKGIKDFASAQARAVALQSTLGKLGFGSNVVKQIDSLTKSLSKISVLDDDKIREVFTTLAQVGKQRGLEFGARGLGKKILEFAQVREQDSGQVALQVGKAISTGNVSMLRKVGINVDQRQFKQNPYEALYGALNVAPGFLEEQRAANPFPKVIKAFEDMLKSSAQIRTGQGNETLYSTSTKLAEKAIQFFENLGTYFEENDLKTIWQDIKDLTVASAKIAGGYAVEGFKTLASITVDGWNYLKDTHTNLANSLEAIFDTVVRAAVHTANFFGKVTNTLTGKEVIKEILMPEFAQAPRHHNGLLNSGEHPAILHSGEAVIPAGMTSMLPKSITSRLPNNGIRNGGRYQSGVNDESEYKRFNTDFLKLPSGLNGLSPTEIIGLIAAGGAGAGVVNSVAKYIGKSWKSWYGMIGKEVRGTGNHVLGMDAAGTNILNNVAPKSETLSKLFKGIKAISKVPFLGKIAKLLGRFSVPVALAQGANGIYDIYNAFGQNNVANKLRDSSESESVAQNNALRNAIGYKPMPGTNGNIEDILRNAPPGQRSIASNRQIQSRKFVDRYKESQANRSAFRAMIGIAQMGMANRNGIANIFGFGGKSTTGVPSFGSLDYFKNKMNEFMNNGADNPWVKEGMNTWQQKLGNIGGSKDDVVTSDGSFLQNHFSNLFNSFHKGGMGKDEMLRQLNNMTADDANIAFMRGGIKFRENNDSRMTPKVAGPGWLDGVSTNSTNSQRNNLALQRQNIAREREAISNLAAISGVRRFASTGPNL